MEQDHPLLVEPFAFAPPLGLYPSSAMKGVRLKERRGPGSGTEGAVWSVSAHYEDRGTEEQGKGGSRRSGAWLVDSGLAWEESSQTFCPLHREHTPVSHLIPPQEWVA